MRFGNYYVSVDENGDLVEYERAEIYEVFVGDEYMLASDQETSLDDFLNTYFDIIVDESDIRYGREVADRVKREILDRSYKIEFDNADDARYVILTM